MRESPAMIMRRRGLGLWLALVVLCLLPGCDAVSRRLVAWKKGEYRGSARLSEHRATAAGHAWVYLDRGQGEPVLLIHGFGGDKDNWTLFARALPDRYRVIAVDLPGFGENSRDPAARYDVRTQSERLLAFVDHLGLARFHLVGNSMGGNLSARFAADHPERVRSLALFDASGVKSPTPSEVARAVDAGGSPLVINTPEDFERILKLNFVKPPDVPRFITRYFAQRAFDNRAFNQKIFKDIGAWPARMEGDLMRIKAPTLVLWGDSDRVIDVSAADVYTAGIAGAKKVVLSACGHLPMIERPQETADHYLAFLRALPQ